MTAAEKSGADSSIIIENLRLGVWNLKIAKTTGHTLNQWWMSIQSAVPLLYRLCSDISLWHHDFSLYLSSARSGKELRTQCRCFFSSLLLRRVCHGHDWLYFPRELSIHYMGSRLRKVSSQENLMLQGSVLRVRL